MKMKSILCAATVSFNALTALAQSQWTGTSPIYYNGGNVGIGTSTPGNLLDVNGTVSAKMLYAEGPTVGAISIMGRGAGSASANLVLQGGGSQAYWISASSTGFKIGNNGGTEPALGVINITTNGQIGIGTLTVNDLSYKLFVETGIRTRKIRVDQDTWADYVFSPTYPRLSIYELETFIKANLHLPGVPSSQEIQKNGLDLGEGQRLLMEKMEELTLYIIELKKENDLIKKQLKQ